MQTIPKRDQDLIVKNLVAACKDIRKLNSRGYGFIYLASGFIAHYNIHGFMAAHESPGLLRDCILDNRANNQWDNFRPGERDYEYYMSKKDVYNRVCDAIR